jgi:hypothetical protein
MRAERGLRQLGNATLRRLQSGAWDETNPTSCRWWRCCWEFSTFWSDCSRCHWLDALCGSLSPSSPNAIPPPHTADRAGRGAADYRWSVVLIARPAWRSFAGKLRTLLLCCSQSRWWLPAVTATAGPAARETRATIAPAASAGRLCGVAQPQVDRNASPSNGRRSRSLRLAEARRSRARKFVRRRGV